LLRHRSFRLLWIGETVSGTGTAMATFVIPLLAVSVLQASTFEVSALTATTYLPWLIIGLPAGAWADRLPVRPLMIACDVAAAVLYASVPVAAWAGVLTIGQVLAVTLLAGAANVVFTTAYQVYLPAVVSAGDLLEGNAKLQGSASMATIAGRSTAGLAADALGSATAVLYNAASFLVSAGCLLCIRAEPARGGRTAGRAAGADGTSSMSPSQGADIARGLGFIARDPYLRPLTAYAAVGNLTYSGYTSLAVIFLVKTVGFGSATAGVLMSATSAGGLVGALAARRLANRFGTVPVMVVTTLITGAAGLLIPLTSTGPWVICYIGGAAGMGVGNLIGNILAAAFRQAYCPPEILGRTVAGMRFVSFGAIPLGALIAGTLGTTVGIRTALWIVLAGVALSGAILLGMPRQRVPQVAAATTATN